MQLEINKIIYRPSINLIAVRVSQDVGDVTTSIIVDESQFEGLVSLETGGEVEPVSTLVHLHQEWIPATVR